MLLSINMINFALIIKSTLKQYFFVKKKKNRNYIFPKALFCV